MQATFFVLCVVIGLTFAQGSASCSSPISVNLGSGNATVFGQTLNADRYEFSTNCNYGDSGTAWYTVTPPSGSHMVVSTCGEYTNFNTHLGLYSGSCDSSLTCLVGNDDGDCPHIDGLQSDTSWWSPISASFNYDPVGTKYHPSTLQWVADGSTYSIAVSGGEEEEGKFVLSFVTVTVNGGCSSAEKILGPYTEVPIVVNQTLPNNPLGVTNCNNLRYGLPAVWFTIYPEPGRLMNVTTCGSLFDTRMAIVAGDCSDLTCLYENDDDYDCHSYGSSIRFMPSLAEYFVVVMGHSSSSSYVGRNFFLQVSQAATEPDQGCVNAFPFHISDKEFIISPEGSTANAMEIANPKCGNEEGQAVWYKVINQYYSGTVTFSTCNAVTDFDTVLTVYSGNCSSFSCKASTSTADCNGFGSSITTTMGSHEEFYLVVSGVNGQTGNFKIDTEISLSNYSPTSFWY